MLVFLKCLGALDVLKHNTHPMNSIFQVSLLDQPSACGFGSTVVSVSLQQFNRSFLFQRQFIPISHPVILIIPVLYQELLRELLLILPSFRLFPPQLLLAQKVATLQEFMHSKVCIRQCCIWQNCHHVKELLISHWIIGENMYCWLIDAIQLLQACNKLYSKTRLKDCRHLNLKC